MNCDCCLKKKRFLESYEAIKTDRGTMNLCVDCTNLVYKIRDDYKAKDKEKYEKNLKELKKRGKKAKPIFSLWLDSFIKNLR